MARLQILRALRHRNYRLFFTGQLISLVGTWMQSVAEAWLVYRLTGSSTLLGVAAFCSQIPVFVLSPIGGATADRFNRHRIIVVTQIASMLLTLALAALTLGGQVRVWQVLALAIALGVVNAFDLPARQSFFVDIVDRDDLLNAIALNSAMFNGARIIGPSVAGLLVATVGEGWCFLLNGLSYSAGIAGLLMMDMTAVADRPPQTGSAADAIVVGFRFVLRTAPVRAVLVLLGIVTFASMPVTVLMPIFADSILHGGASGLGLLMASSGLGAFGGALALAARRDVRGLGRWVAVAAVMFGVTLIVFSLSKNFWLSAAILVPVGAAMIVEFAASNTLLQAMVPDHLRGRVMALYTMMFMGMAPFGALVAGALAERIGAPNTVVAGGVLSIVGGLLFARVLPSIRAEARELIAQGVDRLRSGSA